MTEIDIFLEVFKKAVEKIDDEYYCREDNNDSLSNYPTEDLQKRKELKKYVTKYGERVFCYELYHQIRKLMAAEEYRGYFNDKSIKLQGDKNARLKE